MEETKKAYICGTSWLHELEECRSGHVKVFSSKEEIREKQCTGQCGIVEVEIKFVKWVQAPKM